MHDLYYHSSVDRLKGALEFFKEKSDEIRSVTPTVFFEKAILKIFGKIIYDRAYFESSQLY